MYLSYFLTFPRLMKKNMSPLGAKLVIFFWQLKEMSDVFVRCYNEEGHLYSTGFSDSLISSSQLQTVFYWELTDMLVIHKWSEVV